MNNKCPKCGSQAIQGEIPEEDDSAGEVTVTTGCLDCGYIWLAVYVFSRIEEVTIDNPEKA